MSQWQSGELDANGVRLHYTRTGGAKPPLVLAHGFSDDGLCWTPVARALENDYDVIMVDARGHGLSQATEEGYGNVEQAADLAGAIAALGLRRPVVLGHSMGAATALMLAGTYPDVPGAILLEDPPARWVSEALAAQPQEQWRAQQRERLTAFQRQTRPELIAAQRAATPGWSEDELGPWADAKLRFNLKALNRGDLPTSEWQATLRQITCPALLITADPARGAIVTAATAEALQALVPQLRVAQIPDAGHSIRRDQFERYMQVVRSFLSELSS
jgi:pimeloyl-ACP methyl ester carboxylesterase